MISKTNLSVTARTLGDTHLSYWLLTTTGALSLIKIFSCAYCERQASRSKAQRVVVPSSS